MGIFSRVVLVPLALFLMSLCGSATFAQYAELSGRITDPNGLPVTQVKVQAVNVLTSLSWSTETNDVGLYTIPNLPPAVYRVLVEKQGFDLIVKPDVELHVEDHVVINFGLRIGSVATTVTVEGGAPLVELATSSLGAVVNSTTVRELPLNGRSWTDLATLQPGVDAIHTQADFTANAPRGERGFGAQLTISGARPQQSNYRLNGISINDQANGGPGSVLGGNLGVDAIQEFSVLTSNYPAEYGKTSGGVVNAITRSGTNQFHGAIYEFLRNSALDARNFFDRGKIPPFKRNQFGGSAGGPIRKDRTFIFADYEGLRQSKGISLTNSVPSAAARAGNLSTGKVTVDPSAAKYLAAFYPLPNGPLLGAGDLGIFSLAGQQVVPENFVTSRVDHKISEKDSLFGTYMYDDTDYHSPDIYNVVSVGSHTRKQVVVLEETHIFSPTFVNTARFGYHRAGQANFLIRSAINPLAADPSFGAVPGRDAARVDITGVGTFQGGVGSASAHLSYWNSFQVYDDAFLTHRTHSLKFGGAVERMDPNTLATSTPNGRFTFGSLADFLTNKPKRFSLGRLDKLSPRGMRQTLVGLYVQDDWRWRPNLTLNLGLRYEMVTVPTEVHGQLSNLLNITDPTPHLGDPYFLNPTLRNFAPRVGFAWDPFRNGKTAVRGAFGLYDFLPLLFQFNTLVNGSNPFFLNANLTNLPQGSFFVGAVPLIPLVASKTAEQTFIEHAPKPSYVMQWNFNVQRQLTRDLTARVGYVGSRGVHMPFRADDMDIVIPTQTPVGYLFPSPVGSGTKLNPNFGLVRGPMYEGNSYYNALEVGIQKRMSRGLQMQGSFTWGKSMDTNSATGFGDQFTNSVASWWNWFNTKLSRAVSDYNVGRTLVLNTTWQVPGVKSASGLVGWVANGWQLGAIYIASDGVPFTPTFGSNGDPLGLNSGSPFDFPNRLTGPGCESLVNPGNPQHYIKTQCFTVPTAPSAAFYSANCDPKFGTFPQCFNLRGNAGRNILTGPGLSNLDFSVFKNNPIKRISENFNVQFRAEFFNILNRANFAVPVTPDNTDIFNPAGAPTGVAGLLTSTTTTAREIQFALKLMW